MNLLRRLFGRPNPDTGRSTSSRRASHVTPARSQGAVTPIREAPAQLDEAAGVIDAEEIDQAPGQPLQTEEEAERAPSEAQANERQTLPNAMPEPEPVVEDAPAPRATPKRAMPPAPKPILTRQRQALSYGIASDVGLMRKNNEDACFGMQWHSITVDNRPDFGFFAVADGMGGHLDGERAAGIAVQTLASEMLDKIYVPLLRDFNAGDSPTVLEACLPQKAMRCDKARAGGGTPYSYRRIGLAIGDVGDTARIEHE